MCSCVVCLQGDQLVIVWQITRTDFVNILGIMMKQILYAGKVCIVAVNPGNGTWSLQS